MIGYVYRKEGKYLVARTRNTHAGNHVETSWTEDINSATVFHFLLHRSIRYEIDGAEKLEVNETRTVTILES